MASVSATLGAGYRVGITARGHTWLADEPASVGGDDAGPSPYELLLGALAACTCMTVAMYAQRKEWEIDSVTITLSHDRVHAEDCKECESDTTGYLDRVKSRVEIRGRGLDDEQRKRLQQVALRCPVHKTLEQGITLVDDVTVH